MPFGQQEEKVKGDKPFFKGVLEEYEGKTRITLWATDAFKEFMEKLAGKTA